jgi:hypothetical protein
VDVRPGLSGRDPPTEGRSGQGSAMSLAVVKAETDCEGSDTCMGASMRPPLKLRALRS